MDDLAILDGFAEKGVYSAYIPSDPVRRRAYDLELFKQNDWKKLGQQGSGQREQALSGDATWEEFKPQVIA